MFLLAGINAAFTSQVSGILWMCTNNHSSSNIYPNMELPSSGKQQSHQLLPSSWMAKEEIIMSGTMSCNSYCIWDRANFCGHNVQVGHKNYMFHILPPPRNQWNIIMLQITGFVSRSEMCLAFNNGREGLITCMQSRNKKNININCWWETIAPGPCYHNRSLIGKVVPWAKEKTERKFYRK